MRMTLRAALKWLARSAAHVCVAPMLLSYAIRSRVLGVDRALLASTQLLALIPGLPGQYLRRAFLQRTIEYCDDTVVIEWGTTLSRSGVRLEHRVYIGPGCHLGHVHIGADTLVAAGVHIPSGGATHGIDDPRLPIREQPRQEVLVRIGRGVWIGSAAVVMADIGPDTVVGAGSVVTRALPASVICAGAPARVLRARIAAQQAV